MSMGDLCAILQRQRDDAEEDARRWCNELRDLAAALGFADAIGSEDFGEVHLPALYAWRDKMLARRARERPAEQRIDEIREVARKVADAEGMRWGRTAHGTPWATGGTPLVEAAEALAPLLAEIDALTEAQRDGRACVHCGGEDGAMGPVGWVAGAQVFAHAHRFCACGSAACGGLCGLDEGSNT